jgi:hypothetical protein
MKITKEELNRMIQEELDAFMNETDEQLDLTLEEDDDMNMDMDAPVEDNGMGENEDLMASLKNLYDVLKGMFDGEAEEVEEVDEAKKDDEDEKMDETASLNESFERFKKLANIRG